MGHCFVKPHLGAWTWKAHPSPFYDASKARPDKRALDRSHTKPVRRHKSGFRHRWYGQSGPWNCAGMAVNAIALHLGDREEQRLPSLRTGQSTTSCDRICFSAEQRNRTRGRSCVRYNLLERGKEQTEIGGILVTGIILQFIQPYD